MLQDYSYCTIGAKQTHFGWGIGQQDIGEEWGKAGNWWEEGGNNE